ncbi:MAG: queuosine salvage family protein [Micavibrio sp.]|nr:queuosine salvage family protein [Micavibrio sp.]
MPQPNSQSQVNKQHRLADAVREQAAWVMAQAENVAINAENIPDYVARLLAQYPLVTTLDPEHHFLSQAEPAATVAYVLALDSVNFGSGYFGIAQAAGVSLEYTVVAGALKKAFAENRLNTPEKWAEVTAIDCHDVFAIPMSAAPQLDALMALFANHLQVTGLQMLNRYSGDVMQLLAAAGNSAEALVELVADWPTFRDVAIYRGQEVPFYKRAQILAADMQLALQGKPPAAFTDMDRLTCFADNMVPHVLRHDGIVTYSDDVLHRIEAGIEIPRGSEEETEIRAAGVHGIELMRKAAEDAGHAVTAVNLDHIIWNRGYESGIYAKPTHKTKSVWY